MSSDPRPRPDRNRIRHPPGEDHPARLDRQATLGEGVRRESQRLRGMAVHSSSCRRIDDLTVHFEQAGFETEVQRVRPHTDGTGDVRPDELLSATASIMENL